MVDSDDEDEGDSSVEGFHDDDDESDGSDEFEHNR